MRSAPAGVDLFYTRSSLTDHVGKQKFFFFFCGIRESEQQQQQQHHHHVVMSRTVNTTTPRLNFDVALKIGKLRNRQFDVVLND